MHILDAPNALSQFFEDSLSMRLYYMWIAKAIKHTVDTILVQPGNSNRVVRILECGSRAGGLSAHVVPFLAEYHKEENNVWLSFLF